jgi:hypothetical protein
VGDKEGIACRQRLRERARELLKREKVKTRKGEKGKREKL